MKRLLFAVILVAAAGIALQDTPAPVTPNTAPAATSSVAEHSGDALSRAFDTRANNLQVEGKGKVTRVLPDDNDGSRHQRFILQLDSGQTLLVAHNIDLAPRIPSLQPGDMVAFYGEYEWNERGGVIHWTHHDPQGRHVAGWLKHEGRVYQ